MSAIKLANISKRYTGGDLAVADLSLDIAAGELLVLVGPSGCGKTTTLRLVAGLDAPTQGSIWLDNKEVTHWPAHQRDLAMVFQNNVLYPHLTVQGNLEFGLRLRGVGKKERRARVADYAALLRLESILQRMPAELSGGQQQRTALCRALVQQPSACLLDEPLSHLDAHMREHTRADIRRLQQKLAATMIYVTHDQEEALAMGDRIAVLRDGRLQQIGAPEVVYDQPNNVFVASFIGAPAMNFIACATRQAGGQLLLESPYFSLSIPDRKTCVERFLVGVRPQDILPVGDNADATAEVERVQTRGIDKLAHMLLRTGSTTQALTILLPSDHPIGKGQTVPLHFRRDRLHLFDAATGARIPNSSKHRSS